MDIKQNIIWQHFNPKGQLEIIKCFLAVFMNNLGGESLNLMKVTMPQNDSSFHFL